MTNQDTIIRPTPEAMLKLAQAEEAQSGQGRLKVFLGYAAGVGKALVFSDRPYPICRSRK
jgi:two-component system sensor histidine kinase KdpD